MEVGGSRCVVPLKDAGVKRDEFVREELKDSYINAYDLFKTYLNGN